MNKTVRRGTWILLQHFCPADAEALSVWHFRGAYWSFGNRDDTMLLTVKK